MFNKIAFFSVLVLSTLSSAANAETKALITDKDVVAVVAMNDNTWSVAAYDRKKNLTKLREFHDAGDRGVQQIDYVVSCAKGQLALAGFNLLTANAYKADRAVEPTYADLSFYKPVIEHDMNIVDSVCGDRLALLSNTSSVN